MRDQESSPAVAFHPAAAHRAILFGPFRFDAADRTLSRDGQEIRLPPRALAVLEYLLERPGRVVGKQELVDAVWKDAFVGETSLTEAVGVLRQALGDSAAEPVLIQTVHRRGYRFVGAVRIEARSQTPSTLSPSLAEPAPAPSRTSVSRRAGVLTGLLCALAIAAGAAIFLTRQPAPAVTRATITLPADQAPAPGLAAQPVAAISPDGKRIAYIAGSSGNYRLFLRATDRFEATPIPGTDGGHGPFFSPDGEWLGFFARGRLFVMRLPDGQVLDIAAAGAGHGGWWHQDDTIVFATGGSGGVMRVPAHGGAATPVPVGGLNPALLRHPSLLADGRTLLATLWKMNVRESEIVAIDLERGESRRLTRGVHARPLPDGFFACVRDGNLVAAAITGSAAGQELTLISGVMSGITGAGQYAISTSGTLLYLPDAPSRRLRRLTRLAPDGTEEKLPFEERAFQNAAVSPDGTQVAVTIYDRGASDLWIGDIARGTLLRLTTEGGVVDPVWSADGRTVLFGSSRSGTFRIYRRAADGSGEMSLVAPVDRVSPTAVTAQGLVLAHRLGPTLDIVAIEPDGTVSDWLVTPANESHARLSPDGRWVVFQSNRSGRPEVYLRPLRGAAGERQLSVSGGLDPTWSADGRSIVYASPTRRLFRVDMRDGVPQPPAEIPTDGRAVSVRAGSTGWLAIKALEEDLPLTTLNVVVNWFSELRPRLRPS